LGTDMLNQYIEMSSNPYTGKSQYYTANSPHARAEQYAFDIF